MKSITNSVSLWLIIAMLTYMPRAMGSSICSWTCTCGGAGVSPGIVVLLLPRAAMIEAARNALLSLKGSRRVYLCGLSMGALLAIHLAAKSWVREGLPDLSALALLAPAIEFSGATWLYTQVLGRLPAIPF